MSTYIRVMRERIYTFTAWLFPVLLMLLMSACVPIPIFYPVQAETEDINIPEHHFTTIVVAPSFHPEEVNEFIEVLSKTDNDIEVVDAATVFQHTFPARGANTEVTIRKLLQLDVRNRISAFGIRFIVVLSPYQTTYDAETDFGIAGSGIESTSLMAGLVDLDKQKSTEYFETEAHGRSTNILLGVYWLVTIPINEESAMRKMARRVAAEISQNVTEQSVKIMVVAGYWDAAELKAELKYEKIPALVNKATLGDPDAQWHLYQIHPTEENLVWLCRAADQGQVSARNELGELYLYGSDQFPSDLSRSCMWFDLAGYAQIIARPQTSNILLVSGSYKSA